MIDLERFKSKAGSKKKNIATFFKSLSKMSNNRVDELFHEAHEMAFQQIDCLDCANCCKTTSPIFNQQDVSRIAKHLRIKSTTFSNQYLKVDEDGDMVLKSSPCAFLGEDNKCQIYAVRPKACREYPHTDSKKVKELITITEKNALMCPAVFQMVERIEKQM